MKVVTVETYRAEVCIACDIIDIKDFCHYYFTEKRPWCATITETDYIFTNGNETGALIRFINYGRFPTTDFDNLLKEIKEFGIELCKDINQSSFSIVADNKTYYIELKDKD